MKSGAWRVESAKWRGGACLALLALAVGTAGAQGLPPGLALEAGPAMLTLSSQTLELGLDAHSGALSVVRDKASGRALLEAPASSVDLDLLCDGKWLSESGAQWVLGDRRVRTEGNCGVLEVDRTMPGWRATVTYRVWPDRPVVQRDAALTPTAEAGMVRRLRLSLEGLGCGRAADAQYSLLANWPPFIRDFTRLRPGRTVAESFGGQAGHFVLVHSPAEGLGLAATLVCLTEYASASVTEQPLSVRVNHGIDTIYQPVVGRTERFGSQLLCITHGTWRDALRQARDLYDVVGLTPPQKTLTEARKTIFYSAHPGGTIDSGFQDVGGFAAFAQGLPELKRLGVNTIWLLPFWKGHVYAPSDYYALDPRLGTEADLKALVDQAHGLGMKVLGDLIPHGPLDESGLHKEHRDWISTNEDGTMQYWWGCLSCDYAHPGWAGYMGDHAAYWVKQVGLDGYRVDCAGGGPTNYRPYGDNRPSMSGLYGGLQVLRMARERMEKVHPGPLLLAEAASPALLKEADFCYDWPLMYEVLRAYTAMETHEFVPLLARWLENEQYWLPKGANLMHCLENHDTVRARTVFGPGPERALLALAALIPGSPFLYHFEETGLAPYLSRLYALRAALPELNGGEADFTSAKGDAPEVLVFTRKQGDHTSLVAINLCEHGRGMTVTLPPELEGFRPADRDALGGVPVKGDGNTKVSLTLDPFETAVIVEADRGISPAPAPAAEVPAEVQASPVVSDRDGDLVVRNGCLELVVGKDTGGLMKSLGDLSGKTLVRALSLEEGQRRLWLGTTRLALGRSPADQLTWRREGANVVVSATGTISREEAAGTRPVADYTVSHWVGTGPEVRVAYDLTMREPVRNVLGSLQETLRFDPQATEWCVSTREGFLHDWALNRQRDDTHYTGMYSRGYGGYVWQSRDYPLAEHAPFLAVRGADGAWAKLELAAETEAAQPRNVALKMQLADTPGLHALLQWLDGQTPLNLEAGEHLRLRYTIRIGRWDVSHLRRLCEGQTQRASGNTTLSVRGSRYEFRNDSLWLAISRFGGGRLVDLRRAKESDSLISSSMIYTDAGIYGDYTTPNMQKVRAHVSNSNDPETDLQLVPTPEGWRVTCEGYLRSQDGRGVANPRTRYRVVYDVDGTKSLKVRVGVRPSVTLPQARAFLAQTLSLPKFSSFAVNARDGTATGTPEPGAQRVWESKVQGFGAEPAMTVWADTRNGVRIAGADLATAFQNAFLFRGGGEDGVVFLAFNDFEPADITPTWREAEYTITPIKEGE